MTQRIVALAALLMLAGCSGEKPPHVLPAPPSLEDLGIGETVCSLGFYVTRTARIWIALTATYRPFLYGKSWLGCPYGSDEAEITRLSNGWRVKLKSGQVASGNTDEVFAYRSDLYSEATEVIWK